MLAQRLTARLRIGFMGLDCGEKSQAANAEEIAKAKTIIWNGPMGVFEMDSFEASRRVPPPSDALPSFPSHGALSSATEWHQEYDESFRGRHRSGHHHGHRRRRHRHLRQEVQDG